MLATLSASRVNVYGCALVSPVILTLVDAPVSVVAVNVSEVEGEVTKRAYPDSAGVEAGAVHVKFKKPFPNVTAGFEGATGVTYGVTADDRR